MRGTGLVGATRGNEPPPHAGDLGHRRLPGGQQRLADRRRHRDADRLRVKCSVSPALRGSPVVGEAVQELHAREPGAPDPLQVGVRISAGHQRRDRPQGMCALAEQCPVSGGRGGQVEMPVGRIADQRGALFEQVNQAGQALVGRRQPDGPVRGGDEGVHQLVRGRFRRFGVGSGHGAVDGSFELARECGR